MKDKEIGGISMGKMTNKNSISTWLLLLATASSVLVTGSAQADETNYGPTATVVDAKEVTPKKVEGKADIDDEITNAKLRAVSGAKSDVSFYSSFIYAGSSVLTPLSTQRAQLNVQNNADPTNISGNVAGKYRLTEHDSLMAGLGVQFTPGFTDNSGNNNPQQTTASSPYIDYNRAFRVGAGQHVVDVIISKYTLNTDTADNMNWAFSAQDQIMFNVSQSKLELGGAIAYGKDIYSGQALVQSAPGIYTPKGDYLYSQFSFDPVLEYAFSDKVSFRTVYRMLTLSQSSSDQSIWTAGLQSESMGLGFAVTRDIYLYPNVQWAWQQLALNATTVGFNANINL